MFVSVQVLAQTMSLSRWLSSLSIDSLKLRPEELKPSTLRLLDQTVGPCSAHWPGASLEFNVDSSVQAGRWALECSVDSGCCVDSDCPGWTLGEPLPALGQFQAVQ